MSLYSDQTVSYIHIKSFIARDVRWLLLYSCYEKSSQLFNTAASLENSTLHKFKVKAKNTILINVYIEAAALTAL